MGAFGWSESFRPAGWFGLFPSRATVHLSAATVFLSHKTSRYSILTSFFRQTNGAYVSANTTNETLFFFGSLYPLGPVSTHPEYTMQVYEI